MIGGSILRSLIPVTEHTAMCGLLGDGVILSAAVFQAERRISPLTGLTRKPKCTPP